MSESMAEAVKRLMDEGWSLHEAVKKCSEQDDDPTGEKYLRETLRSLNPDAWAAATEVANEESREEIGRLTAENEALRAKCDALGRVRDAAKIWAYRFSGDCKELDEALAACEDGGRKDHAQEEMK